jgi:hypothetical protein
MTDNYFNHNIVNNHDNRIELLNSMAEFATFMMSLTAIVSDTDMVWYDEMKKSNICYDL